MATATQIRNSELAQIHLAAKELGLDRDTYEDMLFSVARVRSAGSLDWAGRKKVLDHLKARGWKKKPGKKKVTRRLAGDAESKKIRALWLMLHALGAVQNSSEAALGAYVKRITKVEALQWIDGAQAETLIESLKKWALRYLPQAIETLIVSAENATLAADQKAELIYLVHEAFSRETFDPMQRAWQALTDALNPTPKV